MVAEWTAAAVEPGDGGERPPSPEEWQAVEVPGRPATFAGADAVAYRTRFPDPRDGEPRAVLELRGLYAGATVWINGERVHEHDSYFVPARIPFVPEPDNEVVVVCRAPTDRFGGLETTDATPPEASVPSIRWGADVSPAPEAFVSDLRVRGRAGEEPSVQVAATVDAAGSVDDHLTFSLRPEGFRGGGAMERASVEADGGRITVQRELRVREERRWWPRELGAQHQYVVRAKLGGHERTARTGLVAVERDDGDLVVNGRRCPVRGVTVPPGADPELVVDRALEANATLVRPRAHVPPRELHEACDEAGLLVWQDLPLSGPGAFDVDRGKELIRALRSEYGGHPSVACYSVHDAPTDPFEGSLGSGRLGRLRLRWRSWRSGYDGSNADAVAAELPEDRAAYPVVGDPGTAPDALRLSPGWNYCDPEDLGWLLERYAPEGEAIGAFGAGSLTASGGDGVPGLDAAAHEERVGTEDPTASQAYHARTAKAVAESLRRRGPGIVVLDSLFDAADGGGPGLLTADGDEKTPFRALADAYEPVQAVLDEPPAPGVVGVSVINDTGETVDAELSWRAGDRQGSADAFVDAFGRTDGGAAKVPEDADTVELELAFEGQTVTNTYRLPSD